MNLQNGNIDKINQEILHNLKADNPYYVIQILSSIYKNSDNFLDILEIICEQSQKQPIREGEEQQRIQEIVESYLNQANTMPNFSREHQKLKDEINIETQYQILKINRENLEAEKRALSAEKENLELKKMLYQQSIKSDQKTFFRGFAIVSGCILLLFTFLFGQFIFKNVIGLISQTNPTLEKDATPTRKNTTFKDVKNVPDGKFTYPSSRSWAWVAKTLDSSINASRPEFEIEVNLIGSEKAKNKLLQDKEVPFIVVSNPLSYEQFNEIEEKHDLKLKQIPVALDGVVLVVNKNLNISELTKEQVKDIYTGKITNWQEVGGPDARIIPISSNVSKSGTAAWFQKEVLDGEEFKGVEIFREITEAIAKIQNTPYGLFYATASQSIHVCKIKPLQIKNEKTGEFIAPYKGDLVNNCPQKRNQINVKAFTKGEYQFTREIYVVIKLDGGKYEKAGKAYANFLLTEQGQNLLEKNSKFARYR